MGNDGTIYEYQVRVVFTTKEVTWCFNNRNTGEFEGIADMHGVEGIMGVSNVLVAAGDIISYMPAAKATHSSNALGGTLGTLKVSHIFVRKEINPYLVIRTSVLVILQISIGG